MVGGGKEGRLSSRRLKFESVLFGKEEEFLKAAARENQTGIR